MDKEINIVAFDCGNSSVRTILCRYDGKKITNILVSSEPNEQIYVNGFYYWDMLHIFTIMKKGLKKACKMAERIDSMGICTWGVDFLMLDKDNIMLGNALAYRNSIGAEQMQRQTEEEREAMFYRTGILCDKINSIYMLKGMQERMPAITDAADKLLMVPDILNWLFTGKKVNEPSELSTTQLFDAKTGAISREQCEAMNIPEKWFNDIGIHGELIGMVLPEIRKELHISYDIPVVCVPSHDTASAALGVPSAEDEFLFVSAGTWALIGAQCKAPIVTEAVFSGNLTNELGAFGYTTLLKNSAGMFLTQHLKKEYEESYGSTISWDEFTGMGACPIREVPVYDVNDPSLFQPENMAKAIWRLLGDKEKTDEAFPQRDWEKIISSTFYSLAESYAETLQTVINCTGIKGRSIYIVGGGSKNAVINQRFANLMKMPVAACDKECASVGNGCAQLMYLKPEITYEEIRKLAAESLETTVYQPQ